MCTNTHLTDTTLIAGCDKLTDGVLNPDCPDDSLHLNPLFVRTRLVQADGTLGEWGAYTFQDSALCLGPADLADAARKAFRTLTISPSPLHVQPGTTEVLVNMPTITYTDDAAQTFDVTLLGVPVEVQVSPSRFTWTYGDGSAPLVTTDPGRAYPDQTVTHTYVHAAPATITLTTTWTGRFRIQGTTADPADPAAWTPIDGDLTTTSPTHPVTVVERKPRLVNDLAGH